MNHTTVYIVSAVRTPIGKFGGGLADFTAPDLGVIAVRAALQRAFHGELPPERQPGVGGKIEDSIKQANESTVKSHLATGPGQGTASAVPKNPKIQGF